MYTKLALIYDVFLWPEFSRDLFINLEIFLYKWKINTHHDISCGTGDFSFFMKRIGINSSGSDISDEMICLAKKKYPGIKFKKSDMRLFKLKSKVDLITCNFDSINHLLKFREWENTFLSVFDNLNKEGKFLFDINTLFTINNHRDCKEVIIGDLKMNIKVTPSKNNLLIFKIHSSGLGPEHGKKIKEIVKESSFEYLKIKKSLINIGFKKVSIFNKNLGYSSVKKRLYILAEK